VTCQTCRARLPEHLETEDLTVARHLRECPACRAELAALARALALLETDPVPLAPELRLGLWARIEAADREAAPATWERPLALGLAALLLGWVGSLAAGGWPVLLGWARGVGGWPVLLGWARGVGGWPTAGELGAVAISDLSSVLGSLQSGWMMWWQQMQTSWAALPGPHTMGLVIAAAAGALACEWTTRRDLARPAFEPEGAR
jgi:hypothetical protein